MHLATLTADLIPACATAGALAFEEDELFAFFRPQRHQYPGRLRDDFVLSLHKHLNSPEVIIKIVLSDDDDKWWDDQIGSEILGYAVWMRSGQGGKAGCWGEDNWRKSTS